jgi:hydrogenase expression/formation protein HypC
MCVSLPARIISIDGQVASVEINRLRRDVMLVVDGARVGDWVLIYGGVALTVLDEQTAIETRRLIDG